MSDSEDLSVQQIFERSSQVSYGDFDVKIAENAYERDGILRVEVQVPLRVPVLNLNFIIDPIYTLP